MALCKIKTRLKEKVYDIVYRDISTLSRLKQTKSVKIHFDQAEIIKHTSSYYDSAIREFVEILCREDKPWNHSLSCSIPKLWYKMLEIVHDKL